MKTIAKIFRSYAVFDADGRHTNGTDKESNHRYGDAYEYILGSRRTSAELVMEVGIADGSSLLAWREIFPGAQCVGLDIHPAERLRNFMYFGGDRVEYVVGDATQHQICKMAAAGRQFDFICEDATHRLEDTLRILLYLWPAVRPGGLYVVEEFSNIDALRDNVTTLWPNVEIVNTIGPSGGTEPLVVFRKPVCEPIKISER